MFKTKNVVAIGNPVVDYLYSPVAENSLQNTFFSSMPKLFPDFIKETPRPGDTLFVPANILEHGVTEFLKMYDQHCCSAGTTALEQLFGSHVKAAGGSLANTVAALMYSKVAGQALVNAKFVASLPEGADGDQFESEMPKGTITGKRVDKGLISHVFPTGDDRTLLTAPFSGDKNRELDLSNISENTDIVMFEGFLTHEDDIYDGLVKDLFSKIQIANEGREENGKPPVHLVITASSQQVSSMPKFRTFVKYASKLTDVTIHSNTGEFRRLMDNDENWRQPFEPALTDITDSHDLDKAKKRLPGYREAKTKANLDTIVNHAMPMAWDTCYKLRFVMTDGGNTAYVADANGYREYTPKKLDKKDMVGRVGAGDAQMAGFWMAQISGFDEKQSMECGFAAATACIKQQEARLSPDLKWPVTGYRVGATGPVSVLGPLPFFRDMVSEMQPVFLPNRTPGNPQP